MKTKSFRYWTEQDVRYTFGLAFQENMQLLNEWLMTADTQITEKEKQELEILRQELTRNVDFWNEEELKMFFISVFIRLLNINSDQFRIFFDRPLTAEVNNIKLNGVVDMVVATGFQSPVKPFFFLHEYKQESKRDGDPRGQLLAEMLAASTLNENEMPIFGCYVLGRNWFFVVLLQNKNYAVSNAFVATLEHDIINIFKIIRKTKGYFEKFINL